VGLLFNLFFGWAYADGRDASSSSKKANRAGIGVSTGIVVLKKCNEFRSGVVSVHHLKVILSDQFFGFAGGPIRSSTRRRER
jgi:hypothetical protein